MNTINVGFPLAGRLCFLSAPEYQSLDTHMKRQAIFREASQYPVIS